MQIHFIHISFLIESGVENGASNMLLAKGNTYGTLGMNTIQCLLRQQLDMMVKLHKNVFCKIKWESDEDTKITTQKGIRDLRNGYMSN